MAPKPLERGVAIGVFPRMRVLPRGIHAIGEFVENFKVLVAAAAATAGDVGLV
jgi:hypothetical protein